MVQANGITDDLRREGATRVHFSIFHPRIISQCPVGLNQNKYGRALFTHCHIRVKWLANADDPDKLERLCPYISRRELICHITPQG
jgi:glutamine phosphoribosylpyrophosphate amidotransferase